MQYKVWWFVTSRPFEYAIFALIMVNTVTLAMKVKAKLVFAVLIGWFHIC